MDDVRIMKQKCYHSSALMRRRSDSELYGDDDDGDDDGIMLIMVTKVITYSMSDWCADYPAVCICV